MSNEAKISMLQGRIRLLEARGPHNSKICNKLLRKIRQIEKEN